MPLGEVANFVTDYFPLKINFAKRKREFTAKIAILPNGCYAFVFYNILFSTAFFISASTVETNNRQSAYLL
jgi:hypothetical protein